MLFIKDNPKDPIKLIHHQSRANILQGSNCIGMIRPQIDFRFFFWFFWLFFIG
jgi:hypothetical protein